ncbi:MAG: hypothetical protein KJ914_06350 [Gammaproteobacteria bacterium]|nr:hypothetical protein [Gammaproteobacteria bacterium]MBU1725128.1 hypothetical protein [Gammaproteobacteria bacterium]MBU2005010.1 hypothetical protein [Gammaproteobacteria bacterium]
MLKKILHGIAATSLLLLATQPVMAQYNLNSALGTNTNEATEGDASVPFVDLFRTALPFEDARPWLTKGSIRYDADGWPRDLGGGQAGTRFLVNMPAAAIQQGVYTVLYDGEGEIRYGNNAKLVEHGTGWDTVNIQAGSDGMLNATLYIVKSNPANYVRNIRILPPGGICAGNIFQRVAEAKDCPSGDYRSFAEYYNRIIFNPDYLNFMKDFKVIRFMNMSGVTQSEVRSWNQRNTITKASWGGYEGQRGVPLEIMVELANRLNAHPWFSFPHEADNDYITQYAQYVKQNLKPNLRPHLEYSNETWNTLFKQGNYVRQVGYKMGLDSNMNRAGYRYYSERSVEIFKIWERVFGGNERLVRILAGWTINKEVTETILSHKDAYKSADAFAIGPYFFGGHEDVRAVRNLEDVFHLFTDDEHRYSINNVLGFIRMQKELADKYGVDLIAYEGGQGLVDFKTRSDNEHPNPLLYQANRDPRMKGFYQQFLLGWKNEGGKLFMHYSSPRTYQKYGTWGTKEYITQPASQAPKYQAILDFMRSTPCWWEGCNR